MSDEYQLMNQQESIRKILQLKPVFNPATQERKFLANDISSTDLALFAKQGSFDHTILVPFLVSAIQNLETRIKYLETLP